MISAMTTCTQSERYHGCSQTGACHLRERADRFQNRCSSDRKAARQISRQTAPPISGAKTQRALLYVRAKNPNIDKEYLLLQSRSLQQADRPSLSVQTILDEGATHCPDPITDSRPESGARAPNRCLRDCNPIELARTHRVAGVSTAH